MRQEIAVDGFRLAYDRTGQGPRNPAVLLLHGWPGDRTDYRDVAPLLSAAAEVVVPDLRGFGESDKHPVDPARLPSRLTVRIRAAEPRDPRAPLRPPTPWRLTTCGQEWCRR